MTYGFVNHDTMCVKRMVIVVIVIVLIIVIIIVIVIVKKSPPGPLKRGSLMPAVARLLTTNC